MPVDEGPPPDDERTRTAGPDGRPVPSSDTLPDSGRGHDAPTLPAQVAGYEVLGLLGRGGMGVVYKARQPGLGRIVALKMILAGPHADAAERVRFLREAKSVAELRHPNVVEIYELGEADGGLPYFSMEYVGGGTLAQLLRQRRPSLEESAVLVETLAHAVHHAHSANIVHRDLKPENVLLVDGNGLPKITDFGLAKRIDASTGSTPSCGIVGTPSYMAPETADGSGRAPTPRADVYALGAILYECLTGRPPFRGPTLLDTLRLVLDGELVPPHALVPNLPPDLEAICLKCLSREPEARYASADELAEDLRAWLDGDPTQASPVTVRERLSRWARQAGYELHEEIGRSGTAIVYKARHVNLNRFDALKLLPVQTREDADDEWHAFQREATVVARLHHPNIVQIYNLDERRGWAFVSMELADGGSLAKALESGPLPPAQAAALAAMLAQALEYSHSRRVVHRDLNPTNILLTRDDPPVAKITNFGLAKRFEGQHQLTMSGTLLTQPTYLAPESITGSAAVGPLADIYALGAVLYEMLTGRPPFVGASLVETLQLVLKSEPKRPRQCNPAIPRALDDVCIKCLRKNPTQRFSSAAALADALEAAMAGRPMLGWLSWLGRR